MAVVGGTEWDRGGGGALNGGAAGGAGADGTTDGAVGKGTN